MAKKIAIIGTHSTGKSTVIADFIQKYKDVPEFQKIDFIKQVNRDCSKYGLEINERANDLTQLYIASNDLKQIVESSSEKTILSDRCILDTLVYSESMRQKGQISKATVDAVTALTNATLDRYTDIVWLRPEFDVVPDGVRSVDEVWRKELDSIFEYFVSRIVEEGKVHVHTLTGSREERLDQLTTIVFL